MTSRPAPTATSTSTVYRLRLDNLLLALVLCGLVAAAVPMVYSSIKHRSEVPAVAPSAAKPAPAVQVSAATATDASTLTAAQAVASAGTLLKRGQFAAAMELVANLSGPEADAADASGMRN